MFKKQFLPLRKGYEDSMIPDRKRQKKRLHILSGDPVPAILLSLYSWQKAPNDNMDKEILLFCFLN